MHKFRALMVMSAAAFAVTILGQSAVGLPPQAAKGQAKAQVPAQGQAGLLKAGQGSANGTQGLQKAGGLVPAQVQPGLAKASQGAANGQGAAKGNRP